MQVFVPYREPIEVAKCLDKKRLHKQIIECNQILNAINGTSKAWSHHPVVEMYKDHENWLYWYKESLQWYKEGQIKEAEKASEMALKLTPSFLNEEFCNQHKRRLFTKDNLHYLRFRSYGKTFENWYIVNGVLKKYKQKI